MDKDALTYALKLLRQRDYSRADLNRRIEARYGSGSAAVIEWLEEKGYLDDRRFTAAFLGAHSQWGRLRMEAELERRGISEDVRDSMLADHPWASVRDVVGARMARMKLEPPLAPDAAARIARTLGRLGYDPGDIEDEIERLT